MSISTPAQRPPPDVMEPAALRTMLQQAVAEGGTLLDLFLALGEGPVTLLPGSIFRQALEELQLLAVFQELLGDVRVLQQLDAVRCGPRNGRFLVEFQFAQPLELPQTTAFGTVTIKLQRTVAFVIEDGEATLRSGDISVNWLMLSEDVLIRLCRVTPQAGQAEDVAHVAAGNLFSRRIPLAPIVAPAPAPPAPELPPVEEVLSVVHHVAGRVRLHIFALYHNPQLKHRLEQELGRRPDIEHISASTWTSNLLVVYAESLALEDLEEWINCVVHGLEVAVGWEASGQPAPWHTMAASAVVAFWESSAEQGLDAETAAERQQAFGPNQLPEPKPRSKVAMLLDQFKSLPVAMLGASALLSVVTGGVADGIVILGVVALNAGIGFATENWAEQTITSLSKRIQPRALVVRAGQEREVPGRVLVPGDVILLKRGMTVPADARLLAAENLTLDESTLTGESVPAAKRAARLPGANVPLANRHNMAYQGTVVTGGSARALVVATGVATEVGQIQQLMVESRRPETPLQRQLRILGGQLGLLSIGVCGGMFAVGLLRGQGVLPMLKLAVSLAVAAVPEGLPTVATTTLALGLRRLREQQIYVRRLNAVETLGALQYICLDKTGTVTRNRMTLVEVYAGPHTYQVRGSRFQRNGQAIDPADEADLTALLRLTTLCSEVQLEEGDDGAELKGTPTETALVQAALDAGIDLEGLWSAHPLRRTRLRSERRNYMDTLHTTPEGERLLAVKGHPMQVLEMCDRQVQDGVVLPLQPADRARISTQNERMAGRALRVLGVAYQSRDDAPEEQRNLIWVGLAGIADPPRDEMVALMAQLHQAGIHTTMITGDQSATAAAVAQEIGLGKNGRLQTLDAMRLEALEPDVLRSLAQNVDVFSRVSPAHKLQIVKALQKSGYVVAMTGDGVNDGPALRAADIGIAMGKQGSEVAQEVADIIVYDDDLETLIFAVEQGRTIYDDIKKAIHFILSSNTSEILVMFSATAAGIGELLNPLQLLWINLVTDVFPELALGLEPPETGVMQRPPRDPHAPMFAPRDQRRIALQGLLLTAGTMSSYGWGVARYGMGPRASTLAFTSLTVGQLLHAISCRSEPHSIFDSSPYPSNPYMVAAVGGGMVLQGLATLVPGLRNVLGVTRLGILDWLVTGATAATPFVINELGKILLRSQPDDEE